MGYKGEACVVYAKLSRAKVCVVTVTLALCGGVLKLSGPFPTWFGNESDFRYPHSCVCTTVIFQHELLQIGEPRCRIVV